MKLDARLVMALVRPQLVILRCKRLKNCLSLAHFVCTPSLRSNLLVGLKLRLLRTLRVLAMTCDAQLPGCSPECHGLFILSCRSTVRYAQVFLKRLAFSKSYRPTLQRPHQDRHVVGRVGASGAAFQHALNL